MESRKFIVNIREITDPYKRLFKNNIKKTLSEQTKFLDTLQISKLSNNECLLREGKLTESELYDALKNMLNNKFSGNNGLTKGFFLFFWDNIREIYISSIRNVATKKEFSASQGQAIIKLIELKGKGKRFIKNWRPISLLNVLTIKKPRELLLKDEKKILPVLINFEQIN